MKVVIWCCHESTLFPVVVALLRKGVSIRLQNDYVMTKHGSLWPESNMIQVFKFSVTCAVIMVSSQVGVGGGGHDIEMIVVTWSTSRPNKLKSFYVTYLLPINCFLWIFLPCPHVEGIFKSSLDIMNSTLCFYFKLVLDYHYLSCSQHVPIMTHVTLRLLDSLAHTTNGIMAP